MSEPHLTWPEVAAQLHDKLTGRGAEIAYEFQKLEVFVPETPVEDPSFAKWKLNGVVKIRTRDARQA